MNDKLQQQLINDLLIESFEGLDRFDRELLALEKGDRGSETMNNIFRVIHTIKGTAGCLGLGKIEATAHVGESLLSLLRDGKLVVGSAMISALLELSDALRAMLRNLETAGDQGKTDYSVLISKLNDLQSTPPVAADPASAVASPVPAAAAPAPAPAASAPAAASAAAAPASFGFFEPTETDKAAEPEPVAAGRPSVADSAIRVDVGQLDKLMNLVGELVLSRNQIMQNAAHPDAATLLIASQRLNLITTELQGSVMKTRMQPIGNIWTKFPRIVRDLSQELGKKTNLAMEGQETELDRTIIEAIKDPLTHIVRNAVDHGLEAPAERAALGKPEEGRLILRAFHEGGQVNIEFSDDGRGIDAARVKAKAVERGLISADQASRLGERETFNLIFLPGFSTAEKVTTISGRGVGLDVVKTNIEKIGGSVDISSAAGRGTTLKIKIPLTLAIIPALMVTSGGERFAIPQVSLLELVRLEGEDARKKIESVYNAPVYRLRGQLLPLVDLNRDLGLAAKAETAGDAVVNIVVVQADGRQFGLVVDAINDTEEIVVKPLGKQLKGIACFAGATIMGDGRVALILDVLGVAQHAGIISEVRDHNVADEAKTEDRRDGGQTLLLFQAARGSSMAIPLSMVARLEEFPRSAVERTGGQEVVQYRGQIMSLIRVAEYVAGAPAVPEAEQGPLQVVVYSDQGRSVGLVVAKISDIVHEEITVRRSAARDGILGSAVIQKRVTDLLDVPSIIRKADPSFAPVGSN
jgi:two-component system chemotaxis sensor kinase CheA